MHRPEGRAGGGELSGGCRPRPHASGGIHLKSDELRALRNEIGRIDSDILELIARRQEVAREIGLAKQWGGMKVRDKAREKEVLRAFEKGALALGLDPRMAKDIVKALIEGSVEVQEKDSEIAFELRGKSALVVGGAGRMGAWTCRFLSNRGADVKIWDSRGKLAGYPSVVSKTPRADNFDIVVIASPLGRCAQDLKLVLADSPRGLVFDLCSVKSHISSLLRNGAEDGFLVTSVHPMFGPGAPSPRGRNVLVCGCGCEEANDRADQLFSSAGAHVSRIGLDRHDELMAYVLGLSHLCSLVFSGALQLSGKSLAEFKAVQGPSFERMLAMATELSNESRRVYHDIQLLNPHTRRMIGTMEKAMKELRIASLAQDPGRFSRIMDSSRKYLEVD